MSKQSAEVYKKTMDDFVKKRPDLQKKVDQYIDQVMRESEYSHRYLKFKLFRQPLGKKVIIYGLMTITAVGLGYLQSYSERKKQYEKIGLTVPELWKFRWENQFKPAIENFNVSDWSTYKLAEPKSIETTTKEALARQKYEKDIQIQLSPNSANTTGKSSSLTI